MHNKHICPPQHTLNGLSVWCGKVNRVAVMLMWWSTSMSSLNWKITSWAALSFMRQQLNMCVNVCNHLKWSSSLYKQEMNALTSLPSGPGGPCKPLSPWSPLSPRGPGGPSFPQGPRSPCQTQRQKKTGNVLPLYRQWWRIWARLQPVNVPLYLKNVRLARNHLGSQYMVSLSK